MAQGGRYQNNAIILGGNTFANLGLFEKKRHYFFDISFKNINFAHTLPPDKRCPCPPQEWLALSQGGRDRNNGIVWGMCNMLISLGLLKKTSRKQFTVSNTKIVLIHWTISLVIFFSIVATFKEGVYQF